MADREQMIYMLKSVAQMTKPLIEDISEEESMARGDHKFNHIRWQTGHLLHTDMYLLSLFGKDYPDFEASDKIFGGGTGISDNPEEYPPMEELKKKLIEAQDRLIEVAGEMTDEAFAKKVGEGDNKTPLWQMISFLSMHNFYHAGQITQIRKTLGRERPFR